LKPQNNGISSVSVDAAGRGFKDDQNQKKPGNEHPMSTHEHQSDISDTPSTVVSLRGG
jgi:hypothetical protein